MKKIILTSLFALSAALIFGQASFSDNFESYIVGATVVQSSPAWELWPAPGSEDAPITDERSASGNNSLLLQGGAAVDIILPFDEVYEEGAFNLTMQMFIPEGRESYFNFQGEDPAGTLWVLDCFFRENGIFEVALGSVGQDIILSNRYPQGEWFNINIDVNLSENLWRIFINGECLGSFQNADNQVAVASINLFPLNGNNLTFIDDIRWTHNPVAQPVDVTLDASFIASIDNDSEIGVAQNQYFGLPGTPQSFEVVIRNEGPEVIENFTATIETATQSITEEFIVNLSQGQFALVEMSESLTINEGIESGSVIIGNVNGMDDQNTCNNIGPINLIGFRPAEGKKVLVEALSDASVTFSPENYTYMNYMSEKYPDLFAGINVHFADVLQNFDWVGELDNPGTPANEGTNLGAINLGLRLPVVDRNALMLDEFGGISDQDEFNNLESSFVNSISNAPFMVLDHGAQWDGTTRTLDVNVTTEFNLVALTNGRLMVGLIEDGVTGDDQANAFADGANGPMGGFEDLPNPIPSSDILYNQVGRLLFTDFQGLEDAYSETTGLTENHVFSLELPTDWAVQNLSIVSAFINEDGTIGNAQITTVEDAIGNGFTSTIDPVLDASISVAPNPAREYTEITLKMDQPTDMVMSLGDAMGRIIATDNYGTVSGTQTYTFDTSQLSPGIYYFRFGSGNAFTTKRLIITE